MEELFYIQSGAKSLYTRGSMLKTTSNCQVNFAPLCIWPARVPASYETHRVFDHYAVVALFSWPYLYRLCHTNIFIDLDSSFSSTELPD